MKIVGFTQDGAIVEISGGELAHLFGHGTIADLGREFHRGGWDYKLRDKLRIGVEYNIAEVWSWMIKARSAYDKIKSSTGLLRAAADILDQAPPAVLREEEPKS